MQLLTTIAKICNANLINFTDDITITQLTIDSRQIPNQANQQTLFIALKTTKNDGHKYILKAYQKGVRFFLINTFLSEFSHLKDACFLSVSNTLVALQEIATYVRESVHIPIIGITGSNGKTITKEWLAALLEYNYTIVKSPKSFNSQIGVPLSVWNMNESHTLGIFEAGISTIHEMEKLQQIIKPTIGVFTNIGEAHAEGFDNIGQKIDEKLILFKDVETIVYCRDYLNLHEHIAQFVKALKKETNKELQLFSWSYKSNDCFTITSVIKENGSTHIKSKYKKEEHSVTIPFTDAASIENAINCWCTLIVLNTDPNIIKEKLQHLKPISMRLEMVEGENNCNIINDSYNSDLKSLKIALELLNQKKEQQSTTVILSDLLQTGRNEEGLYEEIAQMLQQMKIQKIIAIGHQISKYKQYFKDIGQLESHFFTSTQNFIENVKNYLFHNEIILLKGARSFQFEKILHLLEYKSHQTVMSVNLSSIRHNLQVIKRRLKENVKVMAMVKASSYGSGNSEVANMLEDSGVNYLTVAYPDEGIILRRKNIQLPIMVMSPSTSSFDKMLLWNLEPEIFNLRSLNNFIEVVKSYNKQSYPIHIKLDTGMHRLGFVSDELDMLITTLCQEKSIKVASIFSHFSAADEPQFNDFTHQQALAFKTMSYKIISALDYRPLLHICNTAGAVQFPEYHFDMVRLGLGLYGIDSSNSLNNQLLQTNSLTTTIAQIKKVPIGDTIGYGRRGKAIKNMSIATICIGYADGYPRALSNGVGHVIINNQIAKVIGSIAMDMCMVDVSHIDNVTEGDEVIIFGTALPIQLIAQWANTIPYEIMTNISTRVKRVYINES